MTLARPPTVLSTHTNDYAISRYRRIVEAKTARKNSDADTVIKVTFFIFEISILRTFDHNSFKCGFS